MNEIFPVVAGIVIGFLVQRIAARNTQFLVLVVLSFLYGICASYISGELQVSWTYVLVDTALVMLAAVVALSALRWWASRTSQIH